MKTSHKILIAGGLILGVASAGAISLMPPLMMTTITVMAMSVVISCHMAKRENIS